MDRKIRWRTFWLAVLTVAAVVMLVPTLVPSERLPGWFSSLVSRKVQLGLDLQGGVHLVYSINLDKAVEDKAIEIKREFETRMLEADPPIAGTVANPPAVLGGVFIKLEDPADQSKVETFIADHAEDITRLPCPQGDAAGTTCLRVSTDFAARIKKSALEQAVRTVRDRIDERGVAEPTVIEKEDQIIVELPGLDDAEINRVTDLIMRTARLEFKIVADHTTLAQEGKRTFMADLYRHVYSDPEAARLGITAEIETWNHDESGRRYQDYYLQAKDRYDEFTIEAAKQRGCWNRNLPERGGKVDCLVTGREIIARYLKQLAAKNPEFKIGDDFQTSYEYVRPHADAEDQDPYWRTYYLHRQVELGGSGVARAQVQWDPTTNAPEVLVRFNRWGGRRFGELTEANVGRKMAIILDDKVNSPPIIQSAIKGGASRITMGASDARTAQREAEDLVDVLRTGSLPAPLVMESRSEVGPLLGMDAVRKTKFSFLLGSGLVVLIMLYIYRMSGLLSIIALALNLLFMIAILAALGATLTLPGIAALVLTVGMAVDANIIIYERIREELRLGKSVRGAVEAGFSRGFAAILDGQLTTAVAGYVLLHYGSGPIRGFAYMLLIGIATTLFTATWCTRLFFELYLGRIRKAAAISI